MRRINILSVATAEAAAQNQRVAREVSLTRPTIFTPGTTNYGPSCCIAQKTHGHVCYTFPFYAFSKKAAIHRNATPWITSHLKIYRSICEASFYWAAFDRQRIPHQSCLPSLFCASEGIHRTPLTFTVNTCGLTYHKIIPACHGERSFLVLKYRMIQKSRNSY
jgi:hypothetical protein